MTSEPIFIIGTERSGSNLLRLILNTHSHIFIPHPPHILHYFSPLEASYGDLAKDSHMHRLITDVLRLIRVHIYPWDVEIDPSVILQQARSRSLFGIFAALYDQALAASGKRRWGCKSLYMIHYTQPVLAHFPQAKLIWLYRDPRDVAVSARTSVFGHFHPYFTACLWRREQQIGLDLAARLSPAAIMPMRYEELIAQPVETVMKLCQFLDEPFESGMLDFFKTSEAHKSSELSESWGNTSRPIITDNAGKYRQQLSKAELQAVEIAAGPVMQQLGYVLDSCTPITGTLPLRRKALFYALDRYWQLGVEWRSLQHDRNHWRRWGRAAFMSYLCTGRLVRHKSLSQIDHLDIYKSPGWTS